MDGIGAPANTPTAIIDKLNTEVNAALADPAIKLDWLQVGSPLRIVLMTLELHFSEQILAK